MARNYVAIDEWELWVPDVGIGARNEREIYRHDPDNALSMEIKYVTREQKKRHDRIFARLIREDAQNDSEEAARYMRDLFSKHTRNIRNYSYNGAAITTGADLWDAAEPDLTEEVTRGILIRSSLEEGLAKKLRSPSALCTSDQKTKRDGDAQDATQLSDQIIPAESKRKTQSSEYQTPLSESSEDVTQKQTKQATIGHPA